MLVTVNKSAHNDYPRWLLRREVDYAGPDTGIDAIVSIMEDPNCGDGYHSRWLGVCSTPVDITLGVLSFVLLFLFCIWMVRKWKRTIRAMGSPRSASSVTNTTGSSELSRFENLVSSTPEIPTDPYLKENGRSLNASFIASNDPSFKRTPFPPKIYLGVKYNRNITRALSGGMDESHLPPPYPFQEKPNTN